MKLGRGQVIDILVKGLSLLDKIHVINRFLSKALAAVFAYPEHKPSVVHAGIVHDCVVHDPWRYKHQISGRHLLLLNSASCKYFHSDVTLDEQVTLVVVVGMRA